MPPRFLKTNTTKASSSTNLLNTTMSTSKFSSAAGSCCGGGFAALANAPYGVLLRWILLLLCQSRHGRRPGPQKDNTAAQQKSCFFGVGLRCARQCALRGAAAVDSVVGLLGYSNRGPLPGYPNSEPLPGCFRFSSVRFRPLPSASPFRSCLS